jgi:2-ketocyclohexanecarboxyl-CoA hydrolase
MSGSEAWMLTRVQHDELELETKMIDPTTFEDVLYEVRGRAAWVIINRPKLYNAFRAQTIEELIMAFKLAADDKGVSSVVLTGAGDKAFCTGGDQSAKDGQYDGRGIVGLPIDELQSIIRDIPKPVIARVNGFAIGGGNVFATLCDLTIAADTAKLGQVGPKVGSVDAGWGTAYLARIVGDKKAREMWYLNEQYTAQQAMEMGLVNKVVPAAELDDAVNAWTQTMGERSPTALALAKRSFNADSDNIRGISMLSLNAVKLYYDSAESKEGMRAFQEKRKPDFHKYVK